jgi:8-oxo-dGTP diphosphatase
VVCGEPEVISGRAPQDAVVAVLRRNGRYLIILRGPNVYLPNYWAPLSGRVEPGETQAEAVVREVREEVGLHALPRSRVWRCETDGGDFVLHWWLADAEPGELVLDPIEVSDARWLSPEEFLRLAPIFEADREFFERILPAFAAKIRDDDEVR